MGFGGLERGMPILYPLLPVIKKKKEKYKGLYLYIYIFVFVSLQVFPFPFYVVYMLVLFKWHIELLLLHIYS